MERERNRSDKKRGCGDGGRKEDAVEDGASDGGVERVAAKDGVEGGQRLAPPLARVTLSDRPGEENDHCQRQVVKEELEGHLRSGGRLGVEAAHRVPFRTGGADHDVNAQSDEKSEREEDRAGTDA